MYSQSDEHRRRALDARQKAARAADNSVKLAFDEIADSWLALADQTDWLERQTSLSAAPPRPAVVQQQQQAQSPREDDKR